MRVLGLLFVLACSSCAAVPESLPHPDISNYEEHSPSAVHAVIQGALEPLGLSIVRHDFDGGRGYVKAVSPSGAVTEVRYDWVVAGTTYLEVKSTPSYGGRLSDQVLFAISDALNENVGTSSTS